MRLGILGFLILILVGLSAGIMIAGVPPALTILLITSIISLYIVFVFPVAVIAALLLIIPFNILWLGTEGISGPEIIYGLTYLFLGVSWLFKRMTREVSRIASPITLPLASFFGIAIFASLLGILNGHKFQDWGSELNAIMYYGLCIMMIDFVSDKKVVYNLLSLMVVAAMIGALKIIAVKMMDAQLDMGFTAMETIKFRSSISLWLIIFMIFFAAAVRPSGSRGFRRFLIFLIVLFLGMMILLSFVRSIWISAVFGCAFLFFFSSETQKRNFLKVVSAIILLVSLYLAFSFGLPRNDPLANWTYSVGKRYGSIFSTGGEPDIITRKTEIGEALKKAVEHPFIGNGLGTKISYFRQDNWYGTPLWQTTRYIHNAYVLLFLNMGALGLLSFLWLYISLICYGISLYRKLKDDRDRTTALGISGAFLSLMIAALAGPLFTAPMVTVWVGFLMGVLLVLDKNTGQTEA